MVDKMKGSTPSSPNLPRGGAEPHPGKPNQVGTVVLYGIPIVSLVIECQERLCLAQISNTLLKQFSYNEIHNRRVALGITCVQCTPVQLEILRRAGAMPVSSRRCGMITRREAERLCKSFLGDNAPPRLPDDFAFSVHHECAWGCRGSFLPSRYNSSRAKCIKCTMCGLFFSPNKFIFHSHRVTAGDKYVQPDAANFNSWRRHMKLSGSPPEEVIHAWEDVKAMFNGGTRKRMLANCTSLSQRPPKQVKMPSGVEAPAVAPQPIVPAPRMSGGCQDLAALPISRVAMDLIYNKPAFAAFSSYSSFPWLKRNPILFPHENPFFPMEKTYQSAFRPVQHVAEEVVTAQKVEETQGSDDDDDEVDIETTDDKNDLPMVVGGSHLDGQWSPKMNTKEDKEPKQLVERSPTTEVMNPPSSTVNHHHPQQQQQQQEMLPSTAAAAAAAASSFTQRIWNLSRLSFDGTDRTNFLYRQDLHRHFVLAADAASPGPISLTSKTSGLDCSTCNNHEPPPFNTGENHSKLAQM